MRSVVRWAVTGIVVVAAGCTAPDATVVVYTSLGAEALAWARDGFREAHPGLRVDLVSIPGEQVLERLQSEKEAPRADIWLGAPSWRLAEAAGEGLLGPAAPSWAEGVPDDMRDPSGRWVGLWADPLVLAFGTDAVARSRAPRDWADLQHPRWSGEVVLVEPGASEALSALLAHHMWDAHTRHGDAMQGLDWFGRLDAWRRAYVATEEEAIRHLRVGDGTVSILPLWAAEEGRASGGVDYRVPESETPTLLRGVALVAGAPHADAARAFLDWVGSPDARAALALASARVPAMGLAPGGGPPWVERVRPALRTKVVPADSVAPHVDAWVALWRDRVRGRTVTVF